MGVSSEGKAVLWLSGVFRLYSPNGTEIRIGATKSQGLLALLATSPNGQRTRLWLQAKLWSDRGAEQAAGSLRQSLSQLRKLLQEANVQISSTRHDIQLDLSSLSIVSEGGREFLEGIDVRDSEFDHWLALERGARDGVSETGVAPVLAATPFVRSLLKSAHEWRIILSASNGSDEGAWFEQLFCDAVAQSIRETLNAAISVTVGKDKADLGPDGLLHIRAEAAKDAEQLRLRVTLTEVSGDNQLWAGSRSLPLRGGPPIEHPETLGLVCELSDAILQFLRLNHTNFRRDSPDLLTIEAVDNLFSIEKSRIFAADNLFSAAYDEKPRGLYLAWRAQLRAVLVVEKFTDSPDATVEEALHFANKALELEPRNSMVAALAANVAGHLQRDFERSLELGLLSVRLNPANPMSGNALSSGYLYAKELEVSYAQAANSRNLSLLSKHRFWWDQQLFGSSFVLGKLEEAYRLAKTAHALNPNFRPSLRYLIALSAHFGHFDSAQNYIQKLSVLEPGFTTDRLLLDQDYPTSLIRRAPGLNANHLNDLI